MANCAIKNCGSSYYQHERWRGRDCYIHKCKNGTEEKCNCEPPFRLFPFPSKKADFQSYHKWCVQVNRQDHREKLWEPRVHCGRVCSKHFVDGRPTPTNPYPTQNLGYKVNIIKTKRKKPAVRISQNPVVLEHVSQKPEHLEHPYSFNCSCGCDVCKGCCDLTKNLIKTEAEKELLQLKIDELQIKLKKKTAGVAFMKKILLSDIKVSQFTGLKTKRDFNNLFGLLKHKASKMSYWKGQKHSSCQILKQVSSCSNHRRGPKRIISLKEEMLLVLMKLRCNVTNVLLCSLFDINTGTCSSILTTWIKFMARQLKALIYWPSKQSILSSLPKCFEADTPMLRCIIDCTEIFIERPRMLDLQALTWSDYKKHNTAKVLIAVAPNGSITFVSNAYGGRTSDRHIVRDSGFLKLIDWGDQLLADRGFAIEEDLLLKSASLFIPPGSRGQEQMSTKDVEKTKRIANTRIHVERAIGRIKWFRILDDTLHITLVPLLDDIITVCAALTNLLPPLVK